MAEDKVYHQEVIQDQPFPTEGEANLNVSQSSASGVYSQQKIKDQTFPVKRTATELIGVAINTKSKKILAEFEFTESGALQIGKYTNGVSGDLKISPNGILARNLSGITTFAIDGETGSAIFRGRIRAGSIISDTRIEGESLLVGNISVGDGNIVIDGASKRILISDGTDNRIVIGDV